MLTQAQITLYGKRWGEVCRVNDWHMDAVRLHKAGSATADLSPRHREVFEIAGQHARANHRSITVEDLRKACLALVAGGFVSAKDLDNPKLDRLFALFRLLIEPCDIDAQMDWDDPTRGESRRINRCIETIAPDAYVRTIAADRFGTRLWENLELPERKQLANTLRSRRGRWGSPLTPSPPSDEGESRGEVEQPF